jgi:hypothetical protein
MTDHKATTAIARFIFICIPGVMGKMGFFLPEIVLFLYGEFKQIML